MRHRLSYLRAVALASYLAVLLAGLSGHDLCIGADGHVALELDDHRCCTACGDQEAHAARAERWVARSGGCGDCVDIPLNFAADDHHPPCGKHAVRRIKPAATASLPPEPVSGARCVAVADFLLPPARSVPTFALRSVVLRI